MKSAFALSLVLAACSSSSAPADVAGDYTVDITSKQNGCNLQGWQENATNTGIDVTVTQMKADATITVNGLAGAYVNGVVGGTMFTGTVDGTAVDATLHGTQSHASGNCSYFIIADIAAALHTDTLTGTITYTTQTNHGTDCGSLEGCMSIQDFSGLRPPK